MKKTSLSRPQPGRMPASRVPARMSGMRLMGLPSREAMGRAFAVMVASFALVLLVMNQTGSTAATRFRMAVTDTLAPVVTVVAAPLDALASAGGWLRDIATLRSQNIALKQANTQLLQWQALAKDMEAENRALREMLNVVPAKQNRYITARIVSDMSGPYARSALIGGGAEAGIKKNQAVINEHGLVGRVVDVGDSTSRVLLLSDINSRIPVVAEASGEKTILIGNNNELPTLSYLSPSTVIAVGERIVTSGDGGVFPRGLAVGVVTQVDKGVVKVQPFVDPSRLEYVSAVDFKL
jgi:rod shape-determining protein MreC